MVSPLKLVFLTALVTCLATSGIWLTAYFVGVKPNINHDHKSDKSEPTKSTNPSSSPTASPSPAPHKPENIWPNVLCGDECTYELVESMPIGLFEGKEVKRLKSTFDAWNELLDLAEKNLDVASFYWSLLAKDTNDGFGWDDSAQSGTDIYNKIVAKAKAGVKVRSAENANKYANHETEDLAKDGLANVRTVNFTKLAQRGGVLHTKFWVVDNKHFYLGSANQDWRSLTQVKEMGLLVKNCPCLANDLQNIFEIYYHLGNAEVPAEWPAKFQTEFNHGSPLAPRISGENSLIYLTSSPPSFVPAGREHDGQSIIDRINSAEKIIYISVMDYAPVTMYLGDSNFYWPLIDNALRSAAFDRRVTVRLLVSKWPSTRAAEFNYLHSLNDLDDNLQCKKDKNYKCIPNTAGKLEVKIFEVPPYKVKIPFTRVNHAKYMLTDETATICTSNWSGDYFLFTGGVSAVIRSEQNGKEASIVKDLREIFERDWNSEYATDIREFDNNGNRK